jgi:hypothetical protein
MTGKEHQIEIWFLNTRVKILPDFRTPRTGTLGSKHHTHDPKVSFTLGDKKFEGDARIINKDKDRKLAAEVSKLMDEKYKWSRGMIAELRAVNPAN